jgi:hypothetical protein
MREESAEWPSKSTIGSCKAELTRDVDENQGVRSVRDLSKITGSNDWDWRHYEQVSEVPRPPALAVTFPRTRAGMRTPTRLSSPSGSAMSLSIQNADSNLDERRRSRVQSKLTASRDRNETGFSRNQSHNTSSDKRTSIGNTIISVSSHNTDLPPPVHPSPNSRASVRVTLNGVEIDPDTGIEVFPALPCPRFSPAFPNDAMPFEMDDVSLEEEGKSQGGRQIERQYQHEHQHHTEHKQKHLSRDWVGQEGDDGPQILSQATYKP